MIDTDVDGPKVTFIGTANYVAGKQAGQFLGSRLQRGDAVAFISGAPDNPACTERVKGAQDLPRQAGMNVSNVQPGYSDKDWAQNAMQTSSRPSRT